jgi:hypothetical protein
MKLSCGNLILKNIPIEAISNGIRLNPAVNSCPIETELNKDEPLFKKSTEKYLKDYTS